MAGSGGTATGAWAGWENASPEWRSYLPGAGSGAGWLAWFIDEAALYSFNGTNWVVAGPQLGQYIDLAEISAVEPRGRRGPTLRQGRGGRHQARLQGPCRDGDRARLRKRRLKRRAQPPP